MNMQQPHQSSTSAELGETIHTRLGATNVHIQGQGEPVLLLHGSGPGVTAWANWRLTIPALSEQFTVIAPDLLGFGYTQRPRDNRYSMSLWIEHVVALLDSLELESVSVTGNSFGGALALAFAARYPHRVNKLVLMGSVGTPFRITAELDKVWGYQPSIENMKGLLDIFAYNRNLVTDELAELRYRASVQPGFQEAFSAMFPAPRQHWVDAMVTPDEVLKSLPHECLIIHGREDKVIPMSCSQHLFNCLQKAQLHVFGECGHWTQIEHADRFNKLVTLFLNEKTNAVTP